MAMMSTQAVIEMSTRNMSWGVKAVLPMEYLLGSKFGPSDGISPGGKGGPSNGISLGG